ncbi:MAG: response regulator transcription factor [Alphaproteobacteria bacterium]|nr:response regulator transcription factor [Alphaproteobacteria bacterium]
MSTPKIKTLIVDDEPLARELLASLVRKDSALELVGESPDGADALAKITTLKPDLILLDVQMPVMNGIGLASRLIHRRDVPYIIFVTAYDRYAVKAFELNALDYILKPIAKDRFFPAVEKAKQAISQQRIYEMAEKMLGLVSSLSDTGSHGRQEAIVINTGGKLVSLEPEDIIWIEAANQYVRIHTNRQIFMMAENLGKFADRLDGAFFQRVHRSAIINLAKVRSVARKGSGAHRIGLAGGQEVILTRSKAQLLPLLLKYARSNTGSAQSTSNREKSDG